MESVTTITAGRLLAGSAAVLLSIFVALVLAELFTRLFFPQLAPTREERVEFWKYDPVLGWAHEPNQRGRFKSAEFDVEVAINSSGLRDVEFEVFDDAKSRMLVLGDSFGWGEGVEFHERFDTLLEQRNPAWDLINASVSGYGTDQQYLWLQANGDKYAADALLLLIYQNDFTNNVAAEQYWHFKPYFLLEDDALVLQNVPVPMATLGQRLRRFVMGRTYLYGYLYRKVIYPFNIRRELVRKQQEKLQGVALKKKASSFEVTGALLNALRDYCAERNIQFLVASVPGEQRYRDFLKGYTQGAEIPYLALDGYFADVPSAEYLIPRDKHWNARGHAMAAEAIERYLKDLGIF